MDPSLRQSLKIGSGSKTMVDCARYELLFVLEPQVLVLSCQIVKPCRAQQGGRKPGAAPEMLRRLPQQNQTMRLVRQRVWGRLWREVR